MSDYISGIRYNSKDDGDLKGLVHLLKNYPSDKNIYRDRSINDILKMLLKKEMEKEVRDGVLKVYVDFISKELKLSKEKCIKKVLTEKLDIKLASKWIKSVE